MSTPLRVALAAPLAALWLAACVAGTQREEDRPYRTGTLELHEDGSLRKAQLVDEAEVAGYPGKAGGWVRFHETGAMRGVQLARDFVIAGREIPEATYVWFDEQGALESAWLARDVVYDGIPCNGGWGKVSTGFYPDGTLRHVFLVRDTTIQGVPCRATPFEGVAFHPDGRLSSAQLAEDYRYAGVDFERRETIRLDENGELVTESDS